MTEKKEMSQLVRQLLGGSGVKGEHYPCKPDIFEMTYEAAE